MEKIEWDDSLSIGVKLIDDQHRRLIQHLNDMSAAIESRHGPQEIAIITLSFLIDYTDFHFGAEERHMRETSFPGLERQLEAHREFRKTLTDLESDFTDEGATILLADAIDTFLVNWLRNHIRGGRPGVRQIPGRKGAGNRGTVQLIRSGHPPGKKHEPAACTVPVIYLAGTRDHLIGEHNLRGIIRIRNDVQVARIDTEHFILQLEPDTAAEEIAGFVERSTRLSRKTPDG